MQVVFEIEGDGPCCLSHRTVTARTVKEAFAKLQNFLDEEDDDVILNWSEIRVRLVRTPQTGEN